MELSLTFTSRGSFPRLENVLRSFEKKPPTPPNSNPKPPSQKNPNHSHAHANPNRSYANALNGIESTHHPSQVKTILKSVTLDESYLIDTSDTKTSILAKACLNMQANKEMSRFFSQIKSINQSFVIDERIVWIEISGLLLTAWNPNAYKKVASIWGEIPNSNVNEMGDFVKNNQWSEEDDVGNCGLNHEDPLHVQSPKNDTDIPLGFEAFNCNSKISSATKTHKCHKQQSYFSSAPAKSSHSNKSFTKPHSNHGSMIEAFVSHIEMGKVLGYDMEGTKDDLKKFIDSIGASQ
nr:hypothetical protein [Tanacetum cinerariifolium]